MYNDIEFVCSGNSGRSPLAEAFARRYLDKRGLTTRASSSGTLVDQLKSHNYDTLLKLATHLAPRAIEQRIITPKQVEELKQGRGVKDILDLVFSAVRKREADRRGYALKDKGLLAYWDADRKPQQTIARPEAELVFPMDRDNYDRVSEIYAPTSFRPRIELIGDIKDPILDSFDEFKETVDQIEKTVERVMETYL